MVDMKKNPMKKNKTVLPANGKNPLTIPPNMNDRLAKEWERFLDAEHIALTTEGLTAALSNPQLHIRVGSAIILGRRRETAAISRLKLLLEDQLMVRVEAAMSLYLLGDQSGIPALIAILDGDLLTGAPITAASYLAVTGDPRGYKTVLKALSSNFAGNRLMAAVALKNFIPCHDKRLAVNKLELYNAVEKALKDSNPLVRRELLYILSKLDEISELKYK
jgi:HEAT repeat protein